MKHAKRTKKTTRSAVGETTGEFELGYLYRTIEEHINAFATQPGCPFTVTDVAVRMGDILRLKAAQVRETLRSTVMVSQVQKDGTTVGLRGTGKQREAIHVVARAGRTLSKAARKAISDGQKRRWAKSKKHKPFIMTPARLRSARKNAAIARQARILKLQKAA